MSTDLKPVKDVVKIAPDRKAMPRALFSGMDWFPDCGAGGLDRYFHDEIRTFSEAGMNGMAMVSAAPCTSLGGIAVRKMAGPGASIWHRWTGARALAREAFGRGMDVANAHFALYAFPWLRELPPRVPLVVNFHGPWAGEMLAEARSVKKMGAAIVARWIERSVYRRADRCITLSTAFRDLLHTEYDVPLDRIRVIPGGVDLSGYLSAPDRERAREKLGWPKDRRILLSVRRLARRMGLDLLIEAMADVRREFPDVLLLIGGKGAEHDRLQNIIQEMGLAKNVRLLGFIAEDDLTCAYAAADISVVPTVALEGFGLVSVESLACGIPVLGTAVGGTAEILRPLNPSLLFEDATADAMANRIGAVLRSEIGLPDRKACRAYAQRYGWPSVMPQLLAVFEEAIEERRGRP